MKRPRGRAGAEASAGIDTIFDRIAALPAIARKLRAISRPGAGEVVFEHVTESAQAFVAAMIARRAPAAVGNLWVVCATPRQQERFHAELVNWLPDAALFPDAEIAAVAGALPDPDVLAERLAVLQRLQGEGPRLTVVLNARTLDQRVPAPEALAKLEVSIRRSQVVDRDALAQRLVRAGYEAVPQVADRGQFSVRGGIMDVYSWQQSQPVRIEWFDDEVESIREFDLDRQTSVRPLDDCTLILGEPPESEAYLLDYRKSNDRVIAVGLTEFEANARITESDLQLPGEEEEIYEGAFFDFHVESPGGGLGVDVLREVARVAMRQHLHEWVQNEFTICCLYHRDNEVTDLQEYLADKTQKPEKAVFLRAGLSSGFTQPAAKVAVVPAATLLGHPAVSAPAGVSGRGDRSLARRSQIDFSELTEGSLVVHLEYGLAKFQGLETRPTAPVGSSNETKASEEVMVLEFADAAKLYVPLEQAFLVSRYVGLGKRGANLSRLGDGKWSATKKAAEKSIYDYAAKLLKTQALRDTHAGRAFAPDTPWQHEFEEAFPYRETADQLRAIAETKADMEAPKPMDRLICGDVGFGKTEVAIRAAFKAAVEGRQVAMLVPTTVLAQQHYDTFRDRMASFPLTVEMLSRYRSAAEQHRVAHGLKDGSIDIVVGTHRLISRDIEFKDLGLLIVDEEQRFGVRHKELIKERFPGIDILTLSATPIPRTLYLALTGARSLSTLETPPPNRYPIETVICGYDERIIRDAIDREIERQGQVYFLHNRIESIERVRNRVRALCPRARVELGHGQMDEEQLEGVMQRFVRGDADVLIATTIIESGLDIPNANTIIIDRADRFGLADLYQLRGRVGRGQHKAYAYLMLPRELVTVGEARKRINAIKQYSSLGAGFRIALRDLEIRGAGNILGVAQSGHLTAVGFELYCQLLQQAVAKLRGEKVRPRVEVAVRLDFAATSEADAARHGGAAGEGEGEALWPAFLPVAYIEEPRLRIQAYRQLAQITRPRELKALRDGWRDRFGPLPAPAENLLALARLKLAAAAKRIQILEVRGDKVMLTRHGEYVLADTRFPRLTSPNPESKIRELGALLESLPG